MADKVDLDEVINPKKRLGRQEEQAGLTPPPPPAPPPKEPIGFTKGFTPEERRRQDAQRARLIRERG